MLIGSGGAGGGRSLGETVERRRRLRGDNVANGGVRAGWHAGVLQKGSGRQWGRPWTCVEPSEQTEVTGRGPLSAHGLASVLTWRRRRDRPARRPAPTGPGGACRCSRSSGAARDRRFIDRDTCHGRRSQLVVNLPLTSVTPNPHQPRRAFDQAALQELATSIAEHGRVLQPIIGAAGGGRCRGRGAAL